MFEFIDFPFLIERVIPTLNRGVIMSLMLIIPSAILGTILGITIGTLRVFGPPLIRKIFDSFVSVIRGIPLTVQLMILYFGLPSLPYVKIYLSPYVAALLGFIICASCYQSEYVRGALLSIHQGQITAGRALGMSHLQIIFSVIIPQAIRKALPGCGNELIYLIKDSTLAYIVTCIELTGEAKILVSRTFRPTEIYFTVACYYLFIVSITSWILGLLEKKLAIPGFDTKK